MDTTTTVSPPPAPAPAVSGPAKKNTPAWIVLGIVLIVAALGAWWYAAKPDPVTTTFRMQEGGISYWYSLTDDTVVRLSEEESGVMPLYSFVGGSSVARAENGSLVGITLEGITTVAEDGTRTVLVDGLYDAGHSSIASDASAAALLNTQTNAIDVFSLDSVRPTVLSYEGSVPLPEAPTLLTGTGFLSRDMLVVKTGKDTFQLYRITDAGLEHAGTAQMQGAKTSWVSTAHAYTYGVLTSSGAQSYDSQRCTGSVVATLGGSGGLNEDGVPSSHYLMWDGITNTSSLPGNYSSPGTYCIMGYFNNGWNNWTTSYTVHSGNGRTTSGGSGTGGTINKPTSFTYYALVYTATPTASLTASPTTIDTGGSVLLSWSSANAASCTGTNFSTGGATSGSVSVSPTATTTYTVTCGTASASRTVTVLQRANLIASAVSGPSAVSAGASASFSATESNNGVVAAGAHKLVFIVSQNGSYVTSREVNIASLAVGATTGAQTVSIPFGGAGTYQVRACADYYGSINEVNESDNCGAVTTVTVTATAAVNATLQASPLSIAAGQTATLTWSSTGASVCTGIGFTTNGATSGSVQVTPTETIQYGITCTGDTFTSGDSTVYAEEWWTGGTVTGTSGDTLINTTIYPGYFCEAGGSTWNLVVNTYDRPNGDGDNWLTYTCTYISNPTGTTDKPDEVSYSPGGGCQGGICMTQTSYFRGAPASGGGTGGTDDATVTVTVTAPACDDDIDNDGDGLIDTADTGCDDANDTDETGGGSLSCGVSPSVVPLGGSATYTATATGGTPSSYSWNPANGQSCAAGTGSTKSCTFPTAGNYAMSVSATGFGTAQCTTVAAGVCEASSVQVTATPDRVDGTAPGGASTITWSASAGCSCTISGPGLSSSATTGSQLVTGITAQSTYTLSCSGNVDTATVNIIPRFEEF